MALQEGKKAPAFSLSSADGKIVKLSDFLGKHLVLYFYPKDNTPGCTQEACDFRDDQKEFTKLGAAVAGVSADSAASHQKFQSQHGLPFILLSDESKAMLKAYGVWKKKSLYGKEYMGIERTTVLIDSKGIVRKVFKKVKVDGHITEVLETLRKL